MRDLTSPTLWLLVGLSLATAACELPPEPVASVDLLEGSGSYVFDGYGPLSDKPINVHYHVPEGIHELSTIVIVMHGNNRNANEYRSSWRDKADEYGFIIAAPELDEAQFPGTSGYQLGNVFLDGDRPQLDEANNPSVWTYALIEPLFDDIALRTGNISSIYQLFGHSAGAQFVHRFVQFVPDARYGYAIAANAGWYMLPDDAVAFPYGIAGTDVAAVQPSYFERPLVVHAGTADTDPDSSSLRQTPEADLQGEHRFARANYFVDRSRQIAAGAGSPYAWEIEQVQGVGHDYIDMGRFAADWLARSLGL